VFQCFLGVKKKGDDRRGVRGGHPDHMATAVTWGETCDVSFQAKILRIESCAQHLGIVFDHITFADPCIIKIAPSLL